MCGIIGYVGKKAASPILLEGLRRLEYRGYDSAGVAVLRRTAICSCARKRARLTRASPALLKSEPVAGNLGIGHTRWATHGPPSDENSHPHLDQSGKIAVVHNGVIENYDALKEKLLKAGHNFKSDTDTEVLAHLIGDYYEKRSRERMRKSDNAAQMPTLTQAVCDALREVIGTYGLAVICADQPDTIVGARRGSPLIIGIGKGENFLASDANAIVAAHEKSRLSERLRRGDHHAGTFRRFESRHGHRQRPDQQAGIQPGGRRARQTRALHAQGNLRAAAHR